MPNALKGHDNNYYAPCTAVGEGQSMDPTVGSPCDTSGHSGSSSPKLYPHAEPNWFNGGAVPVLFLKAHAQVGLRWKPIPEIEARIAAGIELTGFWFGISADYGVNTDDKGTHSASNAKRGTSGQGTSLAGANVY